MTAELTIDDLLVELRAGRTIPSGSPLLAVMHRAAQDALRITAELNGSYHDEAEVRALIARLTGVPVDDTVTVFPPFHTDFGRNTRIGRDVFINMGCKFQDQGGLTIGDGALIGHNVVIATLNHDLDPARRADVVPAPVVIGNNAWIGSNATILPGVTIGNGAVVAAASVVTRDVPAGTVVVGSPARVIRRVPGAPG
ncbi:MAG: DapH/DapD/GlmU-related protein [Micropruina sp.]|uniref:DapH/DapD/GlmU-related protein n=1 Tax=Micropruina sp. TaxID=2737536 RepID=UPI0039E37A87